MSAEKHISDWIFFYLLSREFIKINFTIGHPVMFLLFLFTSLDFTFYCLMSSCKLSEETSTKLIEFP